MSRRVRYEVLPTSKAALAEDATLLRWSVTRDSERIATHGHKSDAVQFATTVARSAWKTQRQLGQVRIKGLSGKIQDERTYGADPIETKG